MNKKNKIMSEIRQKTLKKIKRYNKNNTALEHLGKKKKAKNRKWLNNKCESVIKERDKARALMLTSPNTENNRNFAQKLMKS